MLSQWLSEVGRKWNSNVTIEGDGIVEPAVKDGGTSYVLVHNNPEEGPEVEMHLIDNQPGFILSFYRDGIGGCCPDGDPLCAICDVWLEEEYGHGKPYWEQKDGLNCGCFDAESDEYKEIGEKILQESGIEAVRIH